jgi:hypothetical protein
MHKRRHKIFQKPARNGSDFPKKSGLPILRSFNHVLPLQRGHPALTNTMKNTLVLVTDFGGFKAFRLENDHPHSSPRLELLEEYEDAQAHRRVIEEVTDQAGRFRRKIGARGGAAMSDGEQHNMALEKRKRGVRKLAGRLDSLMQNPEIEQCFLAASREIMNPLLQELSPNSRSKIGINIPADLMKVSKAELLTKFRVMSP